MGPATERSAVKVGDRVGIKWVAAICGSCPPCLEGHDAMCHKGKISGYYTYILLSFSLKNRNGDMLGARSAKDKMYKFIDANGIFLGIRPGTFQEYVVSQADYVTPIPEAIKSEDAAVYHPSSLYPRFYCSWSDIVLANALRRCNHLRCPSPLTGKVRAVGRYFWCWWRFR